MQAGERRQFLDLEIGLRLGQRLLRHAGPDALGRLGLEIVGLAAIAQHRLLDGEAAQPAPEEVRLLRRQAREIEVAVRDILGPRARGREQRQKRRQHKRAHKNPAAIKPSYCRPVVRGQ